MVKVSNEDKRYDYIVVGAGAVDSVLAAELSASGAQVLVIESGGSDDAPTIMNPSIWFYNVGGPLDYHLPITPLPHRAGTRVASSRSWTGCSYSNLRFCAHLRMGLEWCPIRFRER